jgi:hypothetical protein
VGRPTRFELFDGLAINDAPITTLDEKVPAPLSRRVQLRLHRLWRLQQQIGKSLSSRECIVWIGFWQLRSHMVFFIDHFVHYVQHDVVDVHYNALIKTIQTTRDFDPLHQAFDHCINMILSQCFLNIRTIHQTLYAIFDHVLEFSVYFEQFPSLRDTSKLHTFQQVYHRHMNFLFRTLSNVQSNLNNPHLTQFLLRLDFNGYYSTLFPLT